MSASRVSAFLYLQPANAAIIAWFWLGEVPSVAVVVGGVMAIAGVAVVNTLGQVKVTDEAIELAEEGAHG
jgi:drug/metabolite transporter (DMT)-like permease